MDFPLRGRSRPWGPSWGGGFPNGPPTNDSGRTPRMSKGYLLGALLAVAFIAALIFFGSPSN